MKRELHANLETTHQIHPRKPRPSIPQRTAGVQKKPTLFDAVTESVLKRFYFKERAKGISNHLHTLTWFVVDVQLAGRKRQSTEAIPTDV